MSRGSYLTAARLAQIESALTPRQRRIASDVHQLNVMSGRQILHLHFEDSDSARRLARLDLAHLAAARVLGRLSRQIGGVKAGSDGFVYVLDVAGQRIFRPSRRPRPPWTPESQHLRHALAVTDLYVGLRARETASAMRLVTFDAEPASWRFYFSPGGGRSVLKPDAFVVVDSDEYTDDWYVEVDRGTESATRITDKARQYVRYWQSGRDQARSGVFPGVLWVVPDDPRAEKVADAIAKLPAEHHHLFFVTTADHAAEALLGGQLRSIAAEGGASA